MKRVESISEVFDLSRQVDNINPYVGTHPKDIITEDLKIELPDIYKILLGIVGDTGFLAGGAVRCLIANEPPADFDFYAYKPEGREILLQKFITAGFVATHFNRNCVMLQKEIAFPAKIKVQVIFSFVGDITTVIDEFDFTVCRIATDGVKLYKDVDFDENLDKKRLRLKTIQCPIGAIRRIIKYGKKGFFLTNFQILKLYEDYIKRGPQYQAALTQLITKQDEGLLTEEDLGALYEIMKRVD